MDEREIEGPFGEFTAYMGKAAERPIWRVKAITLRKNPIYRHLNASLFTDHQSLGTLPNEAELYQNLSRVYGNTEIQDVFCALGAFHGHCANHPVYDGHAKAVMMAAAFNAAPEGSHHRDGRGHLAI